MTDHEVYIYDGDPERVVSVTVGELRGLCIDERGYGVSDEDDSDISIPERTCHMIDGYCDVCEKPDPSNACEARSTAVTRIETREG